MKKSIFIFTLSLFIFSLGADENYTVQKGDTLYGIAKKFGVTADAIQKASNLKALSIKIGQKLIIPIKKNESTPSAEPVKGSVEREIINYTVVKGDSLFGIAKKFAMPIDQLTNLNKLTKNSPVKIGQKLKVWGADSNGPIVVDVDNIPTKPDPENKNPPGLDPIKIVKSGGSWPVDGVVYEWDGKLPGIMIKSKQGTPVLSLTGGKVIHTGPYGGLGEVVIVQNDSGYMYIYGGNESISVINGSRVEAGQILAKLGITDGVEEARAYLNVWKGGTYLDPINAPR